MATRPSYAAIAQHASFEHERLTLSDQSIRLFQVQRGEPNEPVSLRMTQFSAQRRPKYKAVSYTWGSPKDRQQILVNGRAFLLHLNLWHLLYHLRLNGETSFLWADALCINQLNLNERNFHVPLMGRIYEKAESVIVWLGLPSPDRTEIRAFDFVREVSVYRKAHSDVMFTKNYLRPEQLHRWETLYRMTEHDYWKRTWIIQEFLFAPAIEIFSGKSKLDWTQFEDLIDLLRTQVIFENHPVTPRIVQSRTARLTIRRKAGGRSTLHELLREYRDSTCTVRSDKVYGILGLAADCIANPATGTISSIEPDYGKHILEVFLDALKCIQPSLSSNKLLPAAVLLILRALDIRHEDFANYLTDPDRMPSVTQLGTASLNISPEYVSTVLNVFHWTSVRDLQRQLEVYDWGQHIGYQIKKVPSNTLTASSGNRLRRLSSRTVHSSLPADFISNVVDAANLCPELSLLYNYPSTHDLVVPAEHLHLHPEDKRTFSNDQLRKPPLILEQKIDSETLRLGFACTDVQRSDLIVQFLGLDATLVLRVTGYQTRLVGKAMMIRNTDVVSEMPVDPVCEANSWVSHCWASHNPDALQLETDPLSLVELFTNP